MAEKFQFPSEGLVRLRAILAPAGPIPVSRSAWWSGCRTGRYPKPVKLGPRITAWRAEDINKLINKGIEKDTSHD
jgi:predicted DNA-binding transcriptional regulator AlpA